MEKSAALASPRLTMLLAAALGVAAAVPAHAVVTVVRGPATPAGELQTVVNATGLVDLNPGRTPVNSSLGFVSVTSARADNDAGVMGGYAEIDLDADLTVPIGANVGSAATTVLTTEALIVADDPSATYELTLELPFDGFFTVVDGQPTLALTGNLSATVFTLLPPVGTIYQSQLTVEISAANPNYEPLSLFTGVQSPLFGGEQTDYAGATFDVASATVDNIDALVRLTVPVRSGQTLSVSGLVTGIAAPEPGERFTEEDFDVLASAGLVDFSQTARLRIFVPTGVTLQGSDALLAAVVNPAPVPLPAALWMFGSALLALGTRRRMMGSRREVRAAA